MNSGHREIAIHAPLELVDDESENFDCVEVKRRAARRIARALQNLSPAEELEYWRSREREALNRQHVSRAKETQEK